MKIKYLYILTFLLAFSCSQRPDAKKIINQAIKTAGGDLFLKSTIDFDFRDRHYKSIRNGDLYQYERIFLDSLGVVRDVLNNNSFERSINGQFTNVADTAVVKYVSSINSVLYFALLPYRLNDASVNKTYIGESTIKGKAYHKIKVTFQQEGGGEDFRDIFVYWIRKDTYTVDYLAYSYLVDGGGMRFREAYNARNVNGIRFVDYVNYKYHGEEYALEDCDKAFEQNALKKLSIIALENVQVVGLVE